MSMEKPCAHCEIVKAMREMLETARKTIELQKQMIKKLEKPEKPPTMAVYLN